MRIDLLKYIADYLPVKLRSKSLIEFFRALLLDAPNAHNKFERFADDAKYKANANASVISLEHHINREFDVDAKITELDGRPFDFLVSITGHVDENKLKAFVDQYKVFGKSYIFRQGNVKYTASFINHVCEDIREVWTASFIDHVCEDDRKVVISATTLPLPNPDPSIHDGVWVVSVQSSRAVASDIVIFGTCYYYDGLGNQHIASRSWTGTLFAGSTFAQIQLNTPWVEDVVYAKTYITNITPNSDQFYDYITRNIN